jgi:PEP-CTERM motif
MRTATVCLLALVSAGGMARATNLLTNGDFETGVLSPWTVFTTVNGTNGTGLPAVNSFDTTGSGATLAAQFDVGEATFDSTQQGGGLTQGFTAPGAGMYNFFANIASLDDPDGEQNGDAGTFSILIDGTTLTSDPLGAFSSPNEIIRNSLSGTVALTAGGHTFEILITRQFTSQGTDTPQEFVDNLSVSSAAPEPGTFALAALALLGFAFYRLRIRRISLVDVNPSDS